MKIGHYYKMKGVDVPFLALGVSHFYPNILLMQNILGSTMHVHTSRFEEYFTEYNP